MPLSTNSILTFIPMKLLLCAYCIVVVFITKKGNTYDQVKKKKKKKNGTIPAHHKKRHLKLRLFFFFPKVNGYFIKSALSLAIYITMQKRRPGHLSVPSQTSDWSLHDHQYLLSQLLLLCSWVTRTSHGYSCWLPEWVKPWTTFQLTKLTTLNL